VSSAGRRSPSGPTHTATSVGARQCRSGRCENNHPDADTGMQRCQEHEVKLLATAQNGGRRRGCFNHRQPRAPHCLIASTAPIAIWPLAADVSADNWTVLRSDSTGTMRQGPSSVAFCRSNPCCGLSSPPGTKSADTATRAVLSLPHPQRHRVARGLDDLAEVLVARPSRTATRSPVRTRSTSNAWCASAPARVRVGPGIAQPGDEIGAWAWVWAWAWTSMYPGALAGNRMVHSTRRPARAAWVSGRTPWRVRRSSGSAGGRWHRTARRILEFRPLALSGAPALRRSRARGDRLP